MCVYRLYSVCISGVTCEGNFVYLENYPKPSCYKFILEPMEWAAAKDVCSHAHGANLVTFETVEEHQAMIDNLKARSKLGRPKYLTLQQLWWRFSMLIYLFLDVYWLCYYLYCCCGVRTPPVLQSAQFLQQKCCRRFWPI